MNQIEKAVKSMANANFAFLADQHIAPVFFLVCLY